MATSKIQRNVISKIEIIKSKNKKARFFRAFLFIINLNFNSN